MEQKFQSFLEPINCFSLNNKIESILVIGNPDPSPCMVTIAIPTFNRPETFKYALESAINQTSFDDYEILIVDNNPNFDLSDETEKIIRSFNSKRIRYYRNRENIGLFGNWNRCFELAKGKWVSLLHDDDLYFPNFISVMMAIVEKKQNINFLSSRLIVWKEDKKVAINSFAKSVKIPKLNKSVQRYSLLDFYFANRISACGSLILREKVIMLGGFNPDFYPTSDYVFNVRFSNSFNVYLYNGFLGIYRVGLNESLKPEVQVGYIVNDYYLRCKIGELINLPNKLNTSIQKKLALKRVKYLEDSNQKYFNTRFSSIFSPSSNKIISISSFAVIKLYTMLNHIKNINISLL